MSSRGLQRLAVPALIALGLADLGWLHGVAVPRAIAASQASVRRPAEVPMASAAATGRQAAGGARTPEATVAAAPPPLAPVSGDRARPPLAVVYFPVGESRRAPGAELSAALDGVARALLDAPGAIGLIEGHADSSGDEAWNLLLSAQRASWVAAKLHRRGVAVRRMIAIARGSADAGTGEDRVNDRRVEVRLRATPEGGALADSALVRPRGTP